MIYSKSTDDVRSTRTRLILPAEASSPDRPDPFPIRMSTTPQPTDSTQTTPTDRTTRRRTNAPRTFSTTNRSPLPPAFGEEEWATGEP
jgi:hypothetical protein